MSTEPLLGVGSTIGSYRIEALVGRGGMGVVYRAEDLRLGRKVALKVLQGPVAKDPRYRERFLRESRLAASIEHAGIVPVHDAGEFDGTPYIAMRFIDGPDLAELLRREGPLEPRRAVALVGDLAGALDAAHARGLVHRDVKPSNALVGTDADGEHAYLVDFGITQDTTTLERLTASDQLIGTLDYLAPERIRGEPIDGRSDIYALGCVLFECLTAEAPFRGTSEAAVIYGHLEEQPRKPSLLRRDIPPGLDDVIARALAKDPADRWQSGAALRAAARQVLEGERVAAPRGSPRRVAVAVAAVAALALAAAVAALVGGNDGLSGIDENAIGVVDADRGRITAQYAVGRGPQAVTAGGGSVWVANRLDGTVSRIDRGAPHVVSIDVGGEPTGLAFGAGSVWVADGSGRSVAQIAPESNRVIERHEVGNAAHAVAVGFGALWVASAVDASVTRIDLSDAGSRRSIAVDARPSALAAGAGAVWVTSEATGRVLRLDPRTGTPLGSIPVGNGPGAVAVGPGQVWVANRRDGTVSRVDPVSEVTETRRVGRAPGALAIDGDRVWVGVEGRLIRLDSRTLEQTASIDLGSSPAALAMVEGEVWTATTPTFASHRGGTLRVAMLPEIRTLDPAAQGHPLIPILYDGLTGYRRSGGASGSALVANLAAALPEPGADGRSYLFRLRPGVRFANGAVVGPADVRRSLERLHAHSEEPDLPPIRGAEGCTPKRCDLSDGIEIDEAARTVTLHLSRKDPDVLHKLHLASVVPADTPIPLARSGAPLGTGPYLVQRWDPRQGALLVRNPHFRTWSPDRPDGFPDRIEVRLEDPAAQATSADVVLSVRGEQAAQLRARYGARLHAEPGPATQYLFLNVREPPFDDVRVRRALNLAVDRDRVAELLGGRLTRVPTCKLLPPGFEGHAPSCAFTIDPNPAGTWTAPDLARARRLVAASGTRGMRVEFWGARHYAPLGPYFGRLLRRLGYRASVRTFDDLFLVHETSRTETPQIGLWGWIAASAAPFTYLEPLVTCGGGLNLSRFCDRDLDALMERAAATRGPEGVELWRRVDRSLAEQAPVVPLVNGQEVSLTSERVGNFQAHPLWGPLLEQMWVR